MVTTKIANHPKPPPTSRKPSETSETTHKSSKAFQNHLKLLKRNRKLPEFSYT